MRKRRMYKALRGVMLELDILQPELAKALGMVPQSLSARMRGVTPWKLDEMYTVLDYINARAKDDGLPLSCPYEKLHEIFPPRVMVPSPS